MRQLLIKLVLPALVLVLVSCGPLTFTIGGSAGNQTLLVKVVESDGRFVNHRVAIVDVTGLIINAVKPRLLQAGENPVSVLHEKLNTAASDDRVKAVILRLNSPGGGVTASDMMYRQIHRFRQQTNKPVVALMMDVAASGAYYLACASDRIITYPTAVTGSIGVLIQHISVHDGLNRIGVRTEAITSGSNKNVGSPFAKMTNEHRAVLGELVEDFYSRFVEVVRQARPGIPSDQLDRVTDGRVLSGDDAVELGLADATGDLLDAFDEAKRLAGIDRAKLILYHRPLDYVGSPYATAGVSSTEINLVQLNLGDLGLLNNTSGFYYLWRPDL